MRSLLRNDILITCLILYILLTGIAMFLYPGGNRIDENSDNYSFNLNFFSDLGASKTINGSPNIFSLVFFVIGQIILGLSIFLFSYNFKVICTKKRRLPALG